MNSCYKQEKVTIIYKVILTAFMQESSKYFLTTKLERGWI